MSTDNAAFIGTIPQNYDRYLGPLLFEPYAKDMVGRIDTASVNAVLEIACGTGRVTRHLKASLSPTVRIVATDLNADMLTVARAANPGNNIQWQLADAQDLPFDDAGFDIVACQFGFMFVPNKAKAFAEAWRVLKPGGCLLFNTWDKMENNELIHVTNPVIVSYFPTDPPTFYQIPFSFHDEKLIRSLLDQAGFYQIELALVKKEATSTSAKEAAIGLVEGNPVYGFICERDASMVGVIRCHIEKAIADKFGDYPLKSSMQAWVCKAWKKDS